MGYALDEAKLVATVEAMGSRLKALFKSFRLSPEDAEDVLQRTLLATVGTLRSGRVEIQTLEAWIYITARNLCILHKKALQLQRSREVPLEAAVLNSGQLPNVMACLELGALRKHLECLPARHRRLVEMRSLGYSFAEMTAETGYRSVESTRRTLARVTQWLAVKMVRVPRKAAVVENERER
jgi:DNA-directed RNA polymerase specialized sigma24 family protein